MPALFSAAVEGFNFAHFGSQLHHCILNNLNKSRRCNASGVLSLSFVHWAAGLHLSGELEPRATSEQGHGGGEGPASPGR